MSSGRRVDVGYGAFGGAATVSAMDWAAFASWWSVGVGAASVPAVAFAVTVSVAFGVPVAPAAVTVFAAAAAATVFAAATAAFAFFSGETVPK